MLSRRRRLIIQSNSGFPPIGLRPPCRLVKEASKQQFLGDELQKSASRFPFATPFEPSGVETSAVRQGCQNTTCFFVFHVLIE